MFWRCRRQAHILAVGAASAFVVFTAAGCGVASPGNPQPPATAAPAPHAVAVDTAFRYDAQTVRRPTVRENPGQPQANVQLTGQAHHTLPRLSSRARPSVAAPRDLARTVFRADPVLCLAARGAARTLLSHRGRSRSLRPAFLDRMGRTCPGLRSLALRDLHWSRGLRLGWGSKHAHQHPTTEGVNHKRDLMRTERPASSHLAQIDGTCTTSWTGAAGDGAWGTSGNWSTGSVPSADDTVCIPSGDAATISSETAVAASLQADGATVTLTGGSLSLTESSIIGNLAQQGGTLSTADLLVTDSMTWTGGTMTGSGTTTLSADATSTVTTTSGADPIVLDGQALVNQGTLTIDCTQNTDPTGIDGLISGGDGAELANVGTMTLTINGDGYGCEFQQTTGAQAVLANSGTLQLTDSSDNWAVDSIGWTLVSTDSAVVTGDPNGGYTNFELYAGNGLNDPIGGNWPNTVGINLEAGGTYTFTADAEVSANLSVDASPQSYGADATSYAQWLAGNSQAPTLTLGDVAWPDATLTFGGGQATIGDGAGPVEIGSLTADEWTSEPTSVTVNEPSPTDTATPSLCDLTATDGANLTVANGIVDGQGQSSYCGAQLTAEFGGSLTVDGAVIPVDAADNPNNVDPCVSAWGYGATARIAGDFTGLDVTASNGAVTLDGAENTYVQAAVEPNLGPERSGDTAASVLYQSGATLTQTVWMANGDLTGPGTMSVEPFTLFGGYGGGYFESDGTSTIDGQTVVLEPYDYFGYEPVHANGVISGQLTGEDGAAIELEGGYILGLGHTGGGGGPLVQTGFPVAPAGALPRIEVDDGTLINESATNAVDIGWDFQDQDPEGIIAYGDQTSLYASFEPYAGFVFAGATSGSEFADGNPDQALAYEYMPILNFSSEEKWRPLNVDQFFADDFGPAGRYGAYNQICDSSGVCTPITSASQLAGYGSAGDYLEFDNVAPAGVTAEPDDYESPDAACVTGVLLDCDTGAASSIYYTVQGPSPTGLDYIEYWFFYRYNQGYEDIGNHVGDWEGVTVAPTSDNQGIAYVELSHHGDWDSYLVSSLACGDDESCAVAGAENGQTHVDDYPASGSHANYPAPNSGPDDDGNTDGGAPWGNNLDGDALLPVPATAPSDSENWTAGAEPWTAWPGAWGDTPQGDSEIGFTGSPCGPAAESGVAADGQCGPDHSDHFFEPWGGSDTNTVCESGPCPDVRRASQAPTGTNCASWAGPGVAASVCEPDVLARGVRSATFNRRKATFAVWRQGTRKRAASSPGIAQLIGAPLDVGQTVIVSGRLRPGSQLSVEAQRGTDVIEATFRVTKAVHGRIALAIKRAGRRGLRVVASHGSKDLAHPKVTNVEPDS